MTARSASDCNYYQIEVLLCLRQTNNDFNPHPQRSGTCLGTVVIRKLCHQLDDDLYAVAATQHDVSQHEGNVSLNVNVELHTCSAR